MITGNEKDAFNRISKSLNINLVNHLELEGRDLITISNNNKNIFIPAIPFLNTLQSIFVGKYISDESVDMHPNMDIDDVGNIISNPISIELALEILCIKNMFHFIKSIIKP